MLDEFGCAEGCAVLSPGEALRDVSLGARPRAAGHVCVICAQGMAYRYRVFM